MKHLRIFAALIAASLTLGLGACSSLGFTHPVSNPFTAVSSPDTQVLAAYGLVTVALEQAATVAENRATPDAVVRAVNHYAPAALAAANIARDAAISYRASMIAYTQAKALNLPTTQTLLLTSAQAGVRLQSTVADLRTNLAALEAALHNVPGSAASSITAAADQLPAATH